MLVLNYFQEKSKWSAEAAYSKGKVLAKASFIIFSASYSYLCLRILNTFFLINYPL